MTTPEAVLLVQAYWSGPRAGTPCGERAKLACLLQHLAEGAVDWQSLGRRIAAGAINPTNAYDKVLAAIRAQVPALAAYDRGRNGRDYGKPATVAPLSSRLKIFHG